VVADHGRVHDSRRVLRGIDLELQGIRAIEFFAAPQLDGGKPKWQAVNITQRYQTQNAFYIPNCRRVSRLTFDRMGSRIQPHLLKYLIKFVR
jgi:hypothetical protein